MKRKYTKWCNKLIVKTIKENKIMNIRTLLYSFPGAYFYSKRNGLISEVKKVILALNKKLKQVLLTNPGVIDIISKLNMYKIRTREHNLYLALRRLDCLGEVREFQHYILTKALRESYADGELKLYT